MAPVAIVALQEFFKNPENIKAVCDKLPEIAEQFTEVVKAFPALAEKALNQNQENQKVYNEACNVVMEECKKILNEENVSLEDQKYFIDIMMTMVDKMGDHDLENKKHLLDTLRITGEFLLLGPFGIAAEAAYRKTTQKEIEEK